LLFQHLRENHHKRVFLDPSIVRNPVVAKKINCTQKNRAEDVVYEDDD